MKFKRQKRHRRAVRFYTVCFGFREPFKVLCDGTFVHHMLVNRIMPADTALANTLSARVKIFTTKCVLAELKSLGDSHSESLNAAKNLVVARCDHEKIKSAVDCMIDVIGENNIEHFFVATQDAKLRKMFQEIPGVPVIYGLRNALFLEQPSTVQHQFAKSAEEARNHMAEIEYKMLKIKNKVSSSDGEVESVDAIESNQNNVSGFQVFETNIGKKSENLKDKAQFKRKRAKGPNPLSCKKKKTMSESTKNQSSAEQEHLHSDSTARSRKQKIRKRRRSNKISDMAAMETTS